MKYNNEINNKYNYIIMITKQKYKTEKNECGRGFDLNEGLFFEIMWAVKG